MVNVAVHGADTSTHHVDQALSQPWLQVFALQHHGAVVSYCRDRQICVIQTSGLDKHQPTSRRAGELTQSMRDVRRLQLLKRHGVAGRPIGGTAVGVAGVPSAHINPHPSKLRTQSMLAWTHSKTCVVVGDSFEWFRLAAVRGAGLLSRQAWSRFPQEPRHPHARSDGWSTRPGENVAPTWGKRSDLEDIPNHFECLINLATAD